MASAAGSESARRLVEVTAFGSEGRAGMAAEAPFHRRSNRGKLRATHSSRVSGHGLGEVWFAAMPAPCVVRAVSEIPASVLGAATACLPLLCHHEKRPGGELFSPSGPLGHVELPVVCCGNPAQPEAPSNKINNSPVCLTAGGRLMAYPPASSPSVILLTTSEKPIDRDRFPVEESIGSKAAGSRVIRGAGVSRYPATIPSFTMNFLIAASGTM